LTTAVVMHKGHGKSWGLGADACADMVYLAMTHVLGKYVSDNPYFVLQLRYAERSVQNKCWLTVFRPHTTLYSA